MLSFAAVGGALVPAAASACAACSCGDPTLTAVGTEHPFEHRTRGATLLRFWQDTLHDEGAQGHREIALSELRMDVGASFAPSERLVLSAMMPIHARRFEGAEELAGEHLAAGELELGARWVVARDRSFGSKHLLSVLGGLKLPTAAVLRGADGAPLPQRAQVGTGSADVRAGLAYSFFAAPWSLHGSLSAEVPVLVRAGFRPGAAVRSQALVQRQLVRALALRLGAEARHDRPDHGEGEAAHSHQGLGGDTALFAAADVIVAPVTDLMLQLGARLPVYAAMESGHAAQPVLMLSAVYDF